MLVSAETLNLSHEWRLGPELAKEVVKELTHDPDEGEDPKAVRAGRLGGKKGGPSRKAKLSPELRSEIAKKAARARWSR